MNTTIDTPQKIGIGVTPTYGMGEMLQDVAAINAAWFYTWEPDVRAWTTGAGAYLVGPQEDRRLALDAASESWAVQSFRPAPGTTYDLSLMASGGASATGGVMVTFRDAGRTLSLDALVLFDGDDGQVDLGGLTAPSWATQAQVLAWSDTGRLEIDDLALTAQSRNLAQNGGFEDGVRATASEWSLNEGVRVGGTAADRALVLDGAQDGWASQTAKALGGVRYDLTFEVTGVVKAAGGVIVNFQDSAGKTLKSAWLPVGAETGEHLIRDILTPAGTTKALVTAWADTGIFEIDDVVLSQRAANLIKNGDMQSGTTTPSGWMVSKGAATGGTVADRSLVLDGAKAGWAYQDFSVKGKQGYDLTMRADALGTAAGGVIVTFSDSLGKKLGEAWVPVNAQTGNIAFKGLQAPDGAVKARVLVWSDTGKIEVDDVRMAQKMPNTLLNGGMEAGAVTALGVWDFGDGVTLGGAAGARHLVMGGDDGWIRQKFDATPGGVYDLSLRLGNDAGAEGGVVVRFLNGKGEVLDEDWVPFGASGHVAIRGMKAPAGTTDASVVAWTDGGTVTMDDVAFSTQGRNLILDGSFDHKTALPIGHVPMIWGRDDVNARDLAAVKGAPVLLGFNEPDERTQAHMSVAEAIALWPQLMETGARLGSPATTTPGTLGATSWLGKFMAQAEAADLRVDFVAVHYYSTNTSVDAFKTFLTKVHEAYGKPVWVTEWALADWTNPGRFTAAQNAKFFAEAVQMMDDLPFVERHAWFGLYDGMDGWDMNTGLIGPDGAPTVIGTAFEDLAGAGDAFLFTASQDEVAALDEVLLGVEKYHSLAPEDRVGTDLWALFGLTPDALDYL